MPRTRNVAASFRTTVAPTIAAPTITALAVLAAIGTTAGIAGAGPLGDELPLTVTRLSDRALEISTTAGYPSQLVLAGSRGLVVFGSFWSKGLGIP